MNFDIFMIVFEKNIQRLNNYKNNKKRLEVINLFRAIDTINERNKFIKINNENKFNTSNIVNARFLGKLGINMSHQILWENCLQSEKNWFLILEDDIDLKFDTIDSFTNTINQVIDYCNKNASHFVQFDVRNHHLNAQKKYKELEIPNLYKLKPQCGMAAYLINKTGINYFKKLYPFNTYIDVYSNDPSIINNLNSLCYVNSIFVNKGAHREIDKNSELGSIIYSYKY